MALVIFMKTKSTIKVIINNTFQKFKLMTKEARHSLSKAD